MHRPDRDHTAIATTNGKAPARSIADRGRSLVADWSVGRVFCVALAITSLIAAADALLGRRVILVGALIVGPCCGLLTGHAARTAAVGAWAILLAVLLGLADHNSGRGRTLRT
jgi:hypothetical protein